MKKSLVVVVILVIVGFLLVACGDDGEPSAEASPSEPTGSEASEAPSPAETAGGTDSTLVQVWFAGPEGLLVSTREIPSTQAIGRASLKQLLAGPTAEESEVNLSTAIPEGTELLDLSISSGTATVDLSEEFESGGGSASVLARIAQVVYTITQFPTVEAVEFRLEGEPVEVFSGEGLILDGPQTRTDWKESLAPIVVIEPRIGAESGTLLIVSGTANVFEATVSIELVSGDGETLAETFTTATCGTGCRGEFRAEVDFDVAAATQALLRVFESSAEDGSPLHVVEIPVMLLP